jgi:hypothetical protein
MFTKILWFTFLAISLAGFTKSGAATYSLMIDTSAEAGAVGSLDFNFNPGPLTTQAASVQILNFSSDGTLSGSPTTTGDVSGALPGSLTFDNGTAFNDYFQGFTFGSSLSFQVSLYGPALTSPDGTSTSGSAFAFSMFGDAAGTKPVLTTDKANGFAYVVNVNLDGSTSVTDYTQTPEPASWILAAALSAGLAVARRLRCPRSGG